MLQNGSLNVRAIIYRVFVHHHHQFLSPTQCARQGTEAYGYKSSLKNRKYSQHARIQTPVAQAKAGEKATTKSDIAGTNSILQSTPGRGLEFAAFGNDTIYAVSTAPGRAGIAIVRITGPSSLDVRVLQSSKSSILTSAGLQ